MIKKIAIISNSRMLLLFLLISDIPLDRVFFIFDENINVPNSIKNFVKVKKSRNRLESIWNAFYYTIKFKIICYQLGIRKENVAVFGADHITGAKFFLKRYKFILIEDGMVNYNDKAYIRSFLNKVFSIPVYGVYSNVKKIYLTKSENISDLIQNKVEIINPVEKWKMKNYEQRNNILNILNIDFKSILLLKDRRYILYTQPLSEDGILTEKEKINLYENILGNYDLTQMVIKPHPRESTDYQKYFRDCHIFYDNIPSEIIPLLDIKFEKVITLFSTAVLQHHKENIVFYGTKIHPKIYSHFGNIEL